MPLIHLHHYFPNSVETIASCINTFWSCVVDGHSNVLIFFNTLTDGCSLKWSESAFQIWLPIKVKQILNWKVRAEWVSRFNVDFRRSLTFEAFRSVNISVKYEWGKVMNNFKHSIGLCLFRITASYDHPSCFKVCIDLTLLGWQDKPVTMRLARFCNR